MKKLSRKVISLVLICVLIVGVSAPRKAYAVAVVDDAVAIVCCLLAAAGITFATSDGVSDAVSDFLDDSSGQFDSLLSEIATNRVLRGGMEGFLIPQHLASQVRGLLRSLYDYFTVGDDRTGNVVISAPAGSLISDNLHFNTDYVGGTFIDSPYLIKGQYGSFGLSDISVIYFSENGICSLRLSSAGVLSDGDVSIPLEFDSSLPFGFYANSNSGEFSYFANNGDITGRVRYHVFPHDSSAGCTAAFLNGVTYYCFSKTLAPSTGSSYLESLFSAVVSRESGFVFDPPMLGGLSSDVTLPYGLTFPEELTYEDVLDRFEERLAAAAGDLAIVFPEAGAVDNTLTYQEAQEQVLVNVNELGEVTDSPVETNTWLQKLLVALKAIPATLIGLLEALLIKLFCPTDTVLQGGFDGIMAAFKDKTDYQTYMDLLSRFQGLSEPDLDDITINWYGKTYTVITWDFFRRTKAVYSRYLRGFLYLFLLLFNFNNVYKLIRNSSFFDGSGMNQRNQSRKGD